MFKTQIKYDALKEIGSVTKAIVKELRIDVSSERLEISAVDGAHVGMISMQYGKGVFTNYKGEDTSFAIDLERFNDSLKFGKSGQMVEVSIGQENKLEIVTGNVTRKNALLDMTPFADIPPFPNIQLDAYVVMKLEDFIQGVKAGGSVSDELSLVLSQKGLVMTSNGTLDTVIVNVAKEKFSKFEIPNEKISAYPLKMLSDVISNISSEQIVLYADTNKPLRIDFALCEGIGKGKFIIAPRTPDK